MRAELQAEVMRVMELPEVSDETNVEDMDSLARTEISLFAEEKFGVELTDQQIKSAKTFKELHTLLSGKA